VGTDTAGLVAAAGVATVGFIGSGNIGGAVGRFGRLRRGVEQLTGRRRSKIWWRRWDRTRGAASPAEAAAAGDRAAHE